MRLFLFFFVLLSSQYVVAGRSLSTDCDTLVTSDGTKLVVKIESVKQGTIWYYECGSSKRLLEMAFQDIREIRRGKISKSGADLSKDAAVLAEEERVLTNSAKLAALFGAGSLFLWLFSFAFSPWIAILILPCTILGFVFGIKVLRRTKNRLEYRKQRALGRFGIITAGSQLAFGILYFLLAIVLLLFWGW